jgi:hypothetical protein
VFSMRQKVKYKHLDEFHASLNQRNPDNRRISTDATVSEMGSTHKK